MTAEGTPVTEDLLRLSPKGETDRFGSLLVTSIAAPIERDGSFHFNAVMPDTYTLSMDEERGAEPIGLTADGKGLRMRVVRSPYAAVSETVTVGGDPIRRRWCCGCRRRSRVGDDPESVILDFESWISWKSKTRGLSAPRCALRSR